MDPHAAPDFGAPRSPPTNERAAPAGTWCGSEVIAGVTADCPREPTGTQCTATLNHLRRHGSLSTLEARALLYVMHPAGRIAELRLMGHHIVTRPDDEHRCARYHLARGTDHAEHE